MHEYVGKQFKVPHAHYHTAARHLNGATLWVLREVQGISIYSPRMFRVWCRGDLLLFFEDELRELKKVEPDG